MKKKIVAIGWVLLCLLLASIFAITIIAIMEDDGLHPWKLVRGGRGGTVSPVALLPIFLVAIAIGLYWIKRRFFSSKEYDQKRKTESER